MDEEIITVDDWDTSIGDVSWNDDPDADEYQDEPDADQQKDDQKDEPKDEPEDEPKDPKDDPTETSDPTFELKYLGEVKTVKQDEVVKLAQQGLDYDRIRAKYDELKAEMEQYADVDEGIAYIREISESVGKPVNKFVEDLRINALVEAGWDAASAREKVAFDREKRLAAAKQSKTDRAAKMDADKKAEREFQYKEFSNRFPDVKPEEIPPEVFADMESGKRLSDAYELHTTKTGNKALSEKVDALTKEIEALKKNAENSAKSVGSKATDGNQSAVDPYIEDWYKEYDLWQIGRKVHKWLLLILQLNIHR